MTDDGHIGTTHGEFSVCQFFTNGMSEYTRRFVSAQEAVQAFKHYSTESIAVRVMGIVERVIITDGLDFTNLEWRKDKGFTYDGEHYAESPTSLHPNIREEGT